MCPEAIVAGLLCLDLTPQFIHGSMPAEGCLTGVGPLTVGTGGAVSNTGINMIKLGIDTYLCGILGDDMIGHLTVQVLEQQAANSSRGVVLRKNEISPYTIVLSPVGKDRCFLHHAGVSQRFAAADVPDSELRQARLFHFGYPPSIGSMYQNEGSELVAMYRRARAAGVATALDLCMPDAHSASGQADWPRILRLVLPYVDVFMPSFPELLLMLNRPRYDELWSRGAVAEQATPEDMAPLADWALAAGAKVVMLKAGTRGIYLRTAASRASMGRAMPPDRQGWQNRELWAPAYRVASVITTTGAGDSAVAGFLASLLYGCTAERSLSVACAVGACCCEAADTTSGVLSWQATLQRMASGWARLPFDPASTGWRWDETSGVWRGPHDAPA